jgi:hypothetical protein
MASVIASVMRHVALCHTYDHVGPRDVLRLVSTQYVCTVVHVLPVSDVQTWPCGKPAISDVSYNTCFCVLSLDARHLRGSQCYLGLLKCYLPLAMS